mmetsp:Transcript_7511/g.19988  ORF Transcript_7511/g.19988 Transcript_7511/m.19988 type:complete len:278 (-) Transcript_7511:649-1482(-)
MSSPASKAQSLKEAEKLKAEGNALFAKQKYSAAVERYTDAILQCPSLPVLYCNRALCHKKTGDMEAVARDAKCALELDRDSLKGNYLLGSALRLKGVDLLPIAARHLRRALEAARQKGDAIKDEIWAELAACNYELWQQEAMLRSAKMAQLREQLNRWLSAENGGRQKGGPSSSFSLSPKAWEDLFAAAEQGDTPREVPGAFQCPLTMSIFREPVITPAGNSYERTAIESHLARNGPCDPIARDVRVTSDQLVVNVGLRAAVAAYLEEHPWAWDECR